MGGGHHHAPAGPEPSWAKQLAPKSGLCPPEFHYNREIWYPHGGFYCDPKGWRKNTLLTLGGIGVLLYMTFSYSTANEVRHMPPKGWIPSIMWNSNVPDPVDFRGRKLNRDGTLPEGESSGHGHH
ncbi:hypothetical protein CHLRE_17g725400v5 [Chlamydomonas reinhardtii]|uniref:Uncharacterized protein n=1 Tax=Chlamydomonas reinhardtii TaxID=3055 RepID=A8J6N0_CHLRE|nr:uncharacterized protein CHLRE_17g725400v5 [Chlamydomonas reinhardtii]PNW70571.1 hypothetical protein CHLRE_17g725400v5 [Chlamydomonas reinhardtii]|eukprot:XP_001697243.1 predicted protein [Chlamydomonas reinhardtii]